MNDNPIPDNDGLDLEGTRYPRGEAARLVQSALRTSRFLVITDIYDKDGVISILRNYGVDYPDTVPAHQIEYVKEEYSLQWHDVVSSDLRRLLPEGGVICVSPPDHLLCEVCRVGVRQKGLLSNKGQKVCASCKLGSDHVLITKKTEI